MTNRNDNNKIVRRVDHAPVDELDRPPFDDGENEQSLWNLVNERLSGRWVQAFALGIVLASLAAFAGYRSTSVKYESTGIIHVAPKSNVVMREIPETRMVPRYPSFLQTQATLISSSPRVLDRALQSIDANDAPWGDQLEGLRVMRGGLSARVARDSELIQVSFTHESPQVAQMVVNAVIRAYTEFHISADGDDVNQTLRKLRGLRESLRNQRMQRQSQIQEIISSRDYAFSEMNDVISQKAMRLQNIDAEIRQLEYLLSMAETQKQALGDGDGAGRQDDVDLGEDPVTGTRIDPRDLEAFDKELQRLGRIREEARIAMERARERFMPRHRAYRHAEENLRIAERLYRDRQVLAAQEFIESDRLSLANWAMEPQQRLTQLKRDAEKERAILADMQRTQMQLRELHTEVEEIAHEERETSARIRSLDIEADSLRRISVASLGELPSQPAQDRRAALAAVGAIGGIASGIGFFFLLACIDRRVFGVAQLSQEATNRQLLGVLPALSMRASDLESSGVAAHCVHQIRNRIESVRKPGRSAVIAISSPYQGDGKTSLALALAASYAASGYRTVLVDCDMIGRSLSHNLMMTGRTGLQECLRDGDVEKHIKPLHVENLHVLPVGDDVSVGPERLRKGDLELLFQKIRRLHDVVLVDTGPLIGSVETIPVTCAADGVALVMWRGRKQSRLDDCRKLLRDAGARFLGVVLNHAMQSDCNRYLSCSKSSAMAPAHANGASNGKSRNEAGMSRNALLRAMQVTARPKPRGRSSTVETIDS